MNYKYTIPTLFIFTFFTIIQPTTAKNLSCNKEVDEIAQKITVLIDINNKDNGSGILIKQEGNTYTVLTAFHNVKNTSLKYTIITPDEQRYPIQGENIKPLGKGIDLAVVKFVSSKTYQVAKFGNSDLIKRGDNVYVTGFRLPSPSIPAPLYDCFDGQVSANERQRTIDGGYNLVYTNSTVKGMSGGPVLNPKGELIGIHGRGDEYDNRDRDRFAGIPINTYVRIAAGVTDKPSIRGLTADDYFELGFRKHEQKDYREAIVAYTEAIKINPNLDQAYNNRGWARYELGDKQAAIADYNQAIKINPNLDLAYYNRGLIYHQQGKYTAAMSNYNQAVAKNANSFAAINNIGLIKYEQGDKDTAIKQWRQAITINNQLAEPILALAVALYTKGEKQQAYQLAATALKLDKTFADVNVLKKNLWGDKIIRDAKKLLSTLPRKLQ
ncbi:MAG: tetratricopeptide repeat-containing serine protease family protein [Dolichospermum sp.]